jgi:serine/threonine protein phosphatase PrpC
VLGTVCRPDGENVSNSNANAISSSLPSAAAAGRRGGSAEIGTDSNGTACGTALTATRLSRDHHIDDPLEVARIAAAGGFVHKKRVCGLLAVTRSLGDQIVKPLVIAHPHVQEIEIDAAPPATSAPNEEEEHRQREHQRQFLIVACDGLWDVMSDKLAVRLVVEYCIVQGHSKDDAATHLVQEALRRGTADNVTAVVVWLD